MLLVVVEVVAAVLAAYMVLGPEGLVQVQIVAVAVEFGRLALHSFVKRHRQHQC